MKKLSFLFVLPQNTDVEWSLGQFKANTDIPNMSDLKSDRIDY